ncbi:hypothetical protein [Nonomuraea sp. C10]|nr:hypothetical protein [Nonomuraea sp. C10]
MWQRSHSRGHRLPFGRRGRLPELRRPLVLGVMAAAALVVHRLPRRSDRP